MRFNAEALNPLIGYLPPSSPVLPVPMNLRDIVCMFYRVRGYSYSGTAQVVGSAIPPSSFSGTITSDATDELDQYKTVASHSGFASPLQDFVITNDARFGGSATNPLGDWTINLPIWTINYNDGTDSGIVGNHIISSPSDLSGFTYTFTINNLISSSVISLSTQVYFSSVGAFQDLTGSIAFVANDFWPFADSGGTPLYDTATGARL